MRSAIAALVLAAAGAPALAQTAWGVQTFGTGLTFQTIITFDVNTPGTLNVVGSTGILTTGVFINSLDFGPGGTDLYLATNALVNFLYDVDQSNGSISNARGSGINAGLGDMSYDHFADRMLGVSTPGLAGGGARIYEINLTTGAATDLGAVVGYTEGFTVSMAVRQSDGMIFLHGVETDRWYMVNPNTLVATPLGPLGWNTNFGQGASFEPSSGTLYHAMLTVDGGNQNRLATIDTTTGLPTFIGTLGVGLTQISDIAFKKEGCGCVCNYDQTTGPNVCDIFDFLEFGNLFNTGDPCACELDRTTGPNVCDIFDFLEFGNLFNTGC